MRKTEDGSDTFPKAKNQRAKENRRMEGLPLIFIQSSSYTDPSGTYNITNYQYDFDGRLVNRDGDLEQFDAAGRMVLHDGVTGYPDDYYSYDGDGNMTKWSETVYNTTYYYLRSSVFGANVLELNGTGAMFKEYVFSGAGKKIAYHKDGAVTWIHEEPSGKDRREIKQDRTINAGMAYDPMGLPAGNGYSGGGPCPPTTCSSSANSPIQTMMTRGFDAEAWIVSWRNSEWLQSHEFELLEMSLRPIAWIGTRNNRPPEWFPGADKPKYFDGHLEPVYGDPFVIASQEPGRVARLSPPGPPPPGPSQDCLNALAAINKNITGYNNAMNQKDVFDEYGPLEGPVLMAMAVRESNADPNAVEAKGGGRGLMQIDITQTPGSRYANDPRLMTAAGNIAIAVEILNLEDANLINSYGYSYNNLNLLLMKLHIHNAGYFKKTVRTKNGKTKKVVDAAKMQSMTTTVGVTPFDAGTTGGDYVSSIWNLAVDCFGLR